MPAQTDPMDVSSVTDATCLVTVAARVIVVAVTCDTFSPPFQVYSRKKKKKSFVVKKEKKI